MKTVSMVIPVKNEEATIQPLINSIAEQTAMPSEAIFVDGGSTDRTKAILRQNMGRHPFVIKLIETEKSYPGEARNIGIKSAVSELVAFTDAGIRLDKMWLKELLLSMEDDNGPDVVYGAYQPVADSFIRECSIIAYVPARERIAGKYFRTNFIASSLFRKRVFERAGLFPPFRAGEDKILMENVEKSGARISHTEKAVVCWEIPATLKGIFRRFYEFSKHDLIAGRAADWHHSVSRTYLATLVLVALGLAVNPLFFIAASFLWLVRIGLIFARRRHDLKTKYLADPRYLFTIIAIILITDSAMFCGWAKFLFSRVHEDK